jgi:5-methyltetrahydropteroyltriglutamate--homocysteine methyltransferase
MTNQDLHIGNEQQMTILTTHVGSLPRPKIVSDLLFSRENNEKYDQQQFDDIIKKSVEEIVKKQSDIGVSIISDGEMSKISYATYVKDRYNGFAGDSERNPPQDLEKFPNYMKKISDSGGTPTYSRPCCVSEISSKNNNDLKNDIQNLLDASNKVNHKQIFMNSASPGVISLFLSNSYYSSRIEYLDAIASAMQEEYETIVNAGIQLQLDCPDLALSRHMTFKNESDDDFIKIAAHNMEILNESLKNIPSNKLRLHVCWGNYEGPHIHDISIEKIFEVLMSFKGNFLLFESSNPRHQHEWEIFEKLKNKIPENKVLIPGVLDTTSNFVEHSSLVRQRIERFVNIVGKERVIAGTDCGFGTFAGFGNVDPDIAYLKLQSLVEGASQVK